MKLTINTYGRLKLLLLLVTCFLFQQSYLFAQDDKAVTEEKPAPVKYKPVKNTFQSVWIIENQTVMVPVKGTLEFDIMHRFGEIDEGFRDFFGAFDPSNIRLGLSYAPINKLFVGVGYTKEKRLVDGSAKYSIITQTKGKYPVSVTYYGSLSIDTRKKDVADIYDGSLIKNWTDRLLAFHQIIIARKVTEKLSVQVAPSITHQNAVSGYYTKSDSTGTEIYKSMRNDHFAISFAARYKFTNVTSVMFNYDQPLTKHPSNNPNPNISLGIEFNTSSHSFQLFFTNYYGLNPARNNLYNHNDPLPLSNGKYLVGFNITRLWNY
ncbi:MAG TPA: DUF5777 family beta-barrel protein [Chitinophagaceae bacterium]|nr:DUF5777 family beta-barrel protein [Chitinophagaceae bacterium]